MPKTIYVLNGPTMSLPGAREPERMLKVSVIEIHAANIRKRESFRQNSFVSKAAKTVFAGFGADSYRLAIAGLAAMIGAKETAEVTG